MKLQLVLGLVCLVAGLEARCKREVDGWTCARQCLSTNNTQSATDPTDATLRRFKRQVQVETRVSDLLETFQSFCDALNEEPFTCVTKCPLVESTKDLTEEVEFMKLKMCKDVKSWKKDFDCAVDSAGDIKTCVMNECKMSILAMARAVLDSFLSDGKDMKIPGKLFCDVETCVQGCIKSTVEPKCGKDLYEILEKMQSIEDRLLAIVSLEKEPQGDNKCFDIPMKEVPINKEELLGSL